MVLHGSNTHSSSLLIHYHPLSLARHPSARSVAPLPLTASCSAKAGPAMAAATPLPPPNVHCSWPARSGETRTARTQVVPRRMRVGQSASGSISLGIASARCGARCADPNFADHRLPRPDGHSSSPFARKSARQRSRRASSLTRRSARRSRTPSISAGRARTCVRSLSERSASSRRMFIRWSR